MGLLRDLLERRHQDQRDQTFREFDTYKSILMDNRPVEAGGFSDDQKADALSRMVNISAPSKKHAQAITPLLLGLTGLGGGIISGLTGMGKPDNPASASTSASTPIPGTPMRSGSPMGSGESMDVSPSMLAGLDQEGGMGGDMGGIGAEQPSFQFPSTSTTPYTPSPAPFAPPSRVESTSPAPPSTPPSTPSSTPARPRGRGVMSMPTLEERQARARQTLQFNTQLQIEQMRALAPAQAEMANAQLESQTKRYKDLLSTGLDPGTAAVAVGWKVPSGAFTSRTSPVSGNAYIERTNPQTGQKEVGYQTGGGDWVGVPGAQIPNRHTEGVGEQSRTDQLAAYAQRLGKTVDQLTPQERVDATSEATGQLRAIEQAKRKLLNGTPQEKEAAQFFLKGQENAQRRQEISINLGQQNLAANAPPDMSKISRTPGLDQGARDEQWLSTRPLGEQTQIKQLANYELQVSPYMLTRSGKWADLAALAKIYDPSFDASQYPIRQRAKTVFTTGKAGENIRSLNTVIGHMNSLLELEKALKNGDMPSVNRIVNFAKGQLGRPEVNNFQMAANAVIDEMANVFKQTGVTDQSVNQWKTTIGQIQSPTQLNGAVQTGIELLGSRVGALSGQWHSPNAMGETPFQFLTPKSLAILQGLGVTPDRIGLLPQDMPQVKGQAQPNSQPNPQGQPQGQGGVQGGGQAGTQPRSFSSGGYSYVERTDIPSDVTNSLQEGQTHEVTSPGGKKFWVKRYQGRVYQVQGGGNGR